MSRGTCLAVALIHIVAGCASDPSGPRADATISKVLTDRRTPATTDVNSVEGRQAGASARFSGRDNLHSHAIATVNGRPFPRHRIVDLLLASHGVGVLEQLIVLDAAEPLAAEKGIQLTQQDIDAEHDRALRLLVDPLAAVSGGAFHRDEAERVLDRVLADRNVSRDEYDLVMRRNALLRAIVLADCTSSDDELHAEYDRMYGETVSVRHIQVATLAEAARVRRRLEGGEGFEALARTYSANVASAQRGGLLDPFSRTDDRVPEALRAAAFALEPGVVSDPIRVGEWYHVLRVDQRLPAESGSFASRRVELARRLQERQAESALRALYEDLFKRATITIHDPVLERAFRRVHPGRLRQ